MKRYLIIIGLICELILSAAKANSQSAVRIDYSCEDNTLSHDLAKAGIPPVASAFLDLLSIEGGALIYSQTGQKEILVGKAKVVNWNKDRNELEVREERYNMDRQVIYYATSYYSAQNGRKIRIAVQSGSTETPEMFSEWPNFPFMAIIKVCKSR